MESRCSVPPSGSPARCFSASLVVPAALVAQQSKPVPMPRLTEAQQVASAVLALPVQFRSDARVLGYKPGSKELVPLRDTNGEFTCLATQPNEPLHLACYHNSLEPFMARGRQLRANGVKDMMVDTTRFAEVTSGKLAMPKQPAALYQLFGGNYDVSANTVTGARSVVRHLHLRRDGGFDGIAG